jgi:hypothetical protein
MKPTSLGIRLGALALGVALVAAAVVRSDPPPPATSSQAVVTLLQADIDLKDVGDRLKLKDVLELVSTYLTKLNMGKEVLVYVDANAFKAEDEQVTLDQLWATEVEIPAVPKRVSVAALLDLSLGSLPGRNGTYLVRPGLLEITTRKQASPPALLRRKVAAAFAARPLKDAIQDLSDLTGASVTVDARAADKLKQPVTATFRHDTSLGAALRMLTDMNDLKLVVLEDGLYVTTPRNAAAMQTELASTRAPASAQAAGCRAGSRAAVTVPGKTAVPSAAPKAGGQR